MKLAAALAACAAALTAPPPEAGRFGDLRYDAGLWAVEPVGDAFQVMRRDGTRMDAGVWVSIRDAAAEGCTAESLASPLGRSADPAVTTLERPGLRILVSQYYEGCRNARPPTVRACAAVKDKVYRMESPVAGCSGGPGFHHDAMTFLQGLSAE